MGRILLKYEYEIVFIGFISLESLSLLSHLVTDPEHQDMTLVDGMIAACLHVLDYRRLQRRPAWLSC